MLDSDNVILEEAIESMRTRTMQEYKGSNSFNVAYRAGHNDALNEIAALLYTLQCSSFKEKTNKWRNIEKELPKVANYYLCKGKNFYEVEYFDGKKFSHNDSKWIQKWKNIED